MDQICPEATAIPQIGGGYTCGGSDVAEKVIIYRHTDLKSKPEFAGIVQQNQNITISDFTAYIIQHFFVEMFGYTNLGIQEREDRTVNVIDAGTNQTVTTADAQWLIFTYDDPDEFMFTSSTSLNMMVLSPDGNTGYILEPSGEFQGGETRLPDQEQMIDSFELLSTATTGTLGTTAASPSTTTVTAPASQEEREQQAASSPLTQQLYH